VYKLRGIYGHDAYSWWCDHPREADLSRHRVDAKASRNPTWTLYEYSDLVDAVAFLSVMNKRLDLCFRGQAEPRPPRSGLFRSSWQPPPWAGLPRVAISDLDFYRARLAALGEVVFDVCQQMGLPRWRSLRDVDEARWAVIQHYGLWPTPMIDVTRSLRVAASFALRARDPGGRDEEPITGYMYVVGLPNRTGSITCSVDDQMLVASLNAVCPPIARRPHLQEGLLVARFPTYGKAAQDPRKSDLARRTVAQIRLIDRNSQESFWSSDYPRLSDDSLQPPPDRDPLLRAFADRIEYARSDSCPADWRDRVRS
jgi:hypothetical protein